MEKENDKKGDVSGNSISFTPDDLKLSVEGKEEDFFSEKVIGKRKRKILDFLKKSKWIYYLILAFIVSLSVYIRTLNLSYLRDVTNGQWILAPESDPYL